MRLQLLLYSLITLILLSGCHSSNDLIQEGGQIPYLSNASTEIITIIDDSDPVANAYQRLIWKVEKDNGIGVEEIINRGKQNQFGGLILNGFTIDEYLDIRLQLDTAVNHPLIYGTEEVVLLNQQFDDIDEVIPPMMLAASDNDQIKRNLESQFILQQSVLGINFSASIYNKEYTISADWDDAYDFKNGDHTFYKNRIKELNDNRTISALKVFDQTIISEIDSTSNIDSIYQHITPYSGSGLSAIHIDSSIINNSTSDIRNFFQNILRFNGLLVTEVNSLVGLSNAVEQGIDLVVVNDSAITEYQNKMGEVTDRLSSRIQNQTHQKVLLAKYWMHSDPISEQVDYSPWMAVPTGQDLDEGSTILVNNYKELLPFTATYKRDFRLLSYGPEPLDSMEYIMGKFAGYKRNFYNSQFSTELNTFNLARYRFATIIITLDAIDLDIQKDSSFVRFVNDMSNTRKVAVVNFGNPKNLVHFDSTVTQLQLFRRTPHTEVLAAHILFGGASGKGQLPVDLNRSLVRGTAISTPLTRWRYVAPEEVGIDQREMNKIRLVAREGIRRKAFPGCQVFVAKGNNVIYHESFGQHTYSRRKGQPVLEEDIYDIASITKVAATTLAIMKLFEDDKVKLNDRLSKHLDIEKGRDVRNVRIRELLTHTSGIQPNMPLRFIIQHKDKPKTRFGFYRSDSLSNDYPVKVAKNVLYTSAMQDSIWEHVQKLSTGKKRYLYSDVNMYLLQKVIEKRTGKKLDDYVSKHFYKKLGLQTIGYRPLERFDADRIVPTERDKKWRGQELDGYVHDPAAALLGGISGNAGLFSNAHDLAVIGQMLLNNGSYGGRRYFKKETILKFTEAKYVRNRALGFDSNNAMTAKVGKRASKQTYGHLGFTGTAIWMDPQEDLVYVFLSNRIHPNQRNSRLVKYRYRQRIHDIIYRAIEKGRERIEGENIDQAVAMN